jgi:putative flippase GtrA
VLVFGRKISFEFVTYLVVGGFTALIYFCLFYFSFESLGLDYRVSATIAYIFAVGFHFLSNRKFTFKISSVGYVAQGVRYLVILLINYLITILVLATLFDRFELNVYLSSVLSVGFTVLIGYFASKFWVFRRD